MPTEDLASVQKTPRHYCRPGGFSPFMPVEVLLRVSSEGVGNRFFRPSPALPAAPSGVDLEVAPGDFALIFSSHDLYLTSGLLGLGGRAGGAAFIELDTDAAGDAGVIANVAACCKIGELGRGEGEVEKLKAFEATDGVTGWEVEPYGQLGTLRPGPVGQVLFLPIRWNRGWCGSSISDSSVSESCGDEEVKSGMREGERDR
jgi:hypothetical protein